MGRASGPGRTRPDHLPFDVLRALSLPRFLSVGSGLRACSASLWSVARHRQNRRPDLRGDRISQGEEVMSRGEVWLRALKPVGMPSAAALRPESRCNGRATLMKGKPTRGSIEM